MEGITLSSGLWGWGLFKDPENQRARSCAHHRSCFLAEETELEFQKESCKVNTPGGKWLGGAVAASCTCAGREHGRAGRRCGESKELPAQKLHSWLAGDKGAGGRGTSRGSAHITQRSLDICSELWGPIKADRTASRWTPLPAHHWPQHFGDSVLL